MPIAKSSSKSSKTERGGRRAARPDDTATIFVGKVLKPHGLTGELSVAIDATICGVIRPGGALLLRGSGDHRREVVVAGVRPHAGGLLLKFDGIDSREQADDLRGYRLELARTELPSTAPGEYYDFELIGLHVSTTDGRELGRVAELFATGANDVCVVEGKDGRLLLPMSDRAIEKIDRREGRLVVHPDSWVDCET